MKLYHFAIFLGNIGANIFAVKDQRLLTPKPKCCLNGITRQTQLNPAKECGIDTNEMQMPLSPFMTADEVFLTGSAYEIQAVGKIE